MNHQRAQRIHQISLRRPNLTGVHFPLFTTPLLLRFRAMSVRKKSAPSRYSEPRAHTGAVEESLSSVLPQPKTDAKGRLFCPLMNDGAGGWKENKPEELVRQTFILHLHHHYGYAFGQMQEERRVQSGRRSPRVDIVIWGTPGAWNAKSKPAPKMVVECKAEKVPLHPKDYYQGESYARAVGADFLILHNERQTSIFKVVPGLPGTLDPIAEIPKATDWSDATRMEAIRNATRAFSRDEFRNLLFRCHTILRDVHKMEPGKAFDVMSKILFIKMYIERTGSWGTFTTAFLRSREATRLPTDKPVHIQLFEQTKKHYETDELFSSEDNLNEISDATFHRIVQELEKFNLSATGDDVKGIAFEKFLGDTFRGNLGQFFTPRTVVDFMVDLLDPEEGHLICDPCSGSGGFLIRAFEHVRLKIERGIAGRKEAARAAIESGKTPDAEKDAAIAAAFAKENLDLDPEREGSRIRRLSHDYIYGTDAEPRAARTAKMNMIMHGDGHGGIHFHDGLLDINGIFEGRFDLVLTNPPFGSNVGDDQHVGATEQTRVPDSKEFRDRCAARYGQVWERVHARCLADAKASKRVLDLFEIGRDKANRATEVLFVERCLRLLKPGGRMGIVLPDGNLNNPSLAWLRRWAEGHARILAVVSLPEETFKSADASVKASLLFLSKFTAEESARWARTWEEAHRRLDPVFARQRDALVDQSEPAIVSGGDPAVASLLAKLSRLGMDRALPEWKLKEPPAYPQGVVASAIGAPAWSGAVHPKSKKDAASLREEFKERWTDALQESSDKALRELRAGLRRIDREHSRALWASVRETLDYPVFTAAPEQVGITATGADGPNQLPQTLDAYRVFARWVAAGAPESSAPAFA